MMHKPRKPRIVLDLTAYDRDGGYTRAAPFYQVDATPPPPIEWLIKKMIPTQGVGVLVGRWGTCKTYLALEMARCLGTGAEYAGRKTKRCAVLYLAVDRPTQADRRARFMMRHFGVKDLPLFFVRKCPPLKDAAQTLIDTVRAINEISPIPIGVIIIDTLVVAAHWKDEGSSGETQVVIKAMRAVSNATETFILAIDHTGKTESLGPRGSSDKQASTDILLTVKMRDDYNGNLEVSRSTDGPEGQRIKFERVEHNLGKDADGDMMTECTIQWGGEITRDDDDRDAILAAMLTGYGSLNDIAQRAGLPDKSYVWRAIQKMPDMVVKKGGGYELTETGRRRAAFAANGKDEE